MRKAVEDQKTRRFKQRECELVQNVQEIIRRLRESGLPVTIIAVAEAMHKSPGSLNYYPRVRSVFEQIVKGHVDVP